MIRRRCATIAVASVLVGATAGRAQQLTVRGRGQRGPQIAAWLIAIKH